MIHIGLDEKTSAASADILHKYLATEIVLNLKIRNYHWNVEGPNFKELHELFGELYEKGAEYVDEIAERIRML